MAKNNPTGSSEPYSICECHIWSYSPYKTHCPRCGEKVKSYNVHLYDKKKDDAERSRLSTRITDWLKEGNMVTEYQKAYEKNFGPGSSGVEIEAYSTKGKPRAAVISGGCYVDCNAEGEFAMKLPKIGEAVRILSHMRLFDGISEYTLSQHYVFVSLIVKSSNPEWELAALLYGLPDVVTGRVRPILINSVGMVLMREIENIQEPVRAYYMDRVTDIRSDPKFRKLFRDADNWAYLTEAEVFMPDDVRPSDMERLWGKRLDSFNGIELEDDVYIDVKSQADSAKLMLDRIMSLVKSVPKVKK